jgi:S-adenosylmethionine/arginine decarboxylase-like enzyme
MFAAIDVHDRAWPRFDDPDVIEAFVPTVIEAIGMSAHGPLTVARFGGCERDGWSAMQFIETGWITIHTDALARRCVIDVFSCQHFDPEVVADVALEYFGGRRTVRVLQR